MSVDDLLWTAPQRGGLTSSEWEHVADHLVGQLGEFLQRELLRDSNAFISEGRSFGISVDFWSTTPLAVPLDFQIVGTFGASRHAGIEVDYIAVQGWLFPFIAGQRTATTADGYNHIFLRYARVDADDDDWEMIRCKGPGAWRSLGWSPDTYDEFGGLNSWVDAHPRGIG
ncbi:MAG: hypothetical protein AAF802_29040 [Planctomycetota bacterium]